MGSPDLFIFILTRILGVRLLFLFIVNACLFIFGTAIICAQEAKDTLAGFDIGGIPEIELNEAKLKVSAYKYLGPWRAIFEVNGKIPWEDTVHLSLDKDRLVTRASMQKLTANDVLPEYFTLDSENDWSRHHMWENNQVSAIVLRAISSSQQTIILEIDTDNELVIYSNFNRIKKVVPTRNIELGMNLLIPIPLNEGANVIAIKILSTNKPPHLRLAMICDRSKDFQAAWSTSLSFLNKQVFIKSANWDPPILWWDTLLDRLNLTVEIDDMKTGNPVFVKEGMRHGDIIRDGLDYLLDGFYRISYKSGMEEAREYFLIGSPKTAFNGVKDSLSGYSWDDETQLNIEAQLRRGEILLEKGNYDTDNREWQDKMVYTLGSLADFLELRKNGATEYSKDIPGLHIRGFISQLDGSKQFYRLFIPSNYTRAQGVPLLLIMPTTISARNRPFIGSPFMAAHRDAMQLSRFAEKHGFALLWPGYRNVPEGWTYESVHIMEAVDAVEKSYNIDKSRTSIYGVCSGGFLGGRLLSDYPKRFAGIIYDRAIFDRDQSIFKNLSGNDDFLKDWLSTINPSNRIISNSSVKILVLHDGSRPTGHGEIQLTEDFLQKAIEKKNDIKSLIGRRPMGVELWDLVFDWLAHCKNNNPKETTANIARAHGYTGPISEIFAHPFVVVKGTNADQEGAYCIEAAIRLLSEKYSQQFYGASFVVKKDTEITKDELESKSLILVGNPESNDVWKTLASQLPVTTVVRGLTIDGYSFSAKSAYIAIFRSPKNRQNFLLLIGAANLNNLSIAFNNDPCRTWVDACVYEVIGNNLIREFKLNKLESFHE